MERRIVKILFVILLFSSICLLAGCNKEDDKYVDPYLHIDYLKNLEAEGNELKYSLTFPNNETVDEKAFSLKISNEKDIQTLNLKTKISSADIDRLLTFTDFNSDGYIDIVVLYDGIGSGSIYNIWFWNEKTSEYVEGVKAEDNSFSNYRVVSEGKIVTSLVQETNGNGEYRAYSFDDKFSPVLQRKVSYTNLDDGSLKIDVTDYSNGAFLMYSSKEKEFNKDLFYEMLLAGLDGKTLTISEAVNLVEQNEQAADVDCEGFAIEKDILYYILRVDKSNATPAFYFVNFNTGEVKKVQGSSYLI